MSDRFEQRLRNLLADVADRTPVVATPQFRAADVQLVREPDRRSRVVVAVAAAVVFLVGGVVAVAMTRTSDRAVQTDSAPLGCAVTSATGVRPGWVDGSAPVPWVEDSTGWVSNPAVAVSLPVRSVLPALRRDVNVLATKFPVWRAVPGTTTAVATNTVSGSVVDADSSNGSYGSSGFQPIDLLFNSSGCWSIQLTVGDAEPLTFVVYACETTEFGAVVADADQQRCGATDVVLPAPTTAATTETTATAATLEENPTTSSSSPANDVVVWHEQMTVDLTADLTCTDQIDMTGSWESVIVDNWIDFSNQRLRTTYTYPDGSTTDTLSLGGLIYPTSMATRGEDRSPRPGCVVDGESHPLGGLGGFPAGSLNAAGQLSDSDRRFIRTTLENAEPVDGTFQDSLGRSASLWSQRIAGTNSPDSGQYDAGAAIEQTTETFVEPGTERVLEVRFTNRIEGFGTTVTTTTSVTVETTNVSAEWFEADGYDILPGDFNPRDDFQFPRNDSGMTYGSATDATSFENLPDLILTIGDDGTLGYVTKADFHADPPASPEAAASYVPTVRIIPLYAQDGVTVIGAFTSNS